MSIISNALKKTQETRNVNIENKNTIKYIFPEYISQKKFNLKQFWNNQKNNASTKKIIITIVAVLALLVLLRTVFHFFSSINSNIQNSSNIISEQSKTANSLNLTGIMFSPDKPYAVINGNIVSEGTCIGNFSILKIFPDKIKIVSSEEEEFVISLK